MQYDIAIYYNYCTFQLGIILLIATFIAQIAFFAIIDFFIAFHQQQQLQQQQHLQQQYPEDYTHYPHPEEYLNERNQHFVSNGEFFRPGPHESECKFSLYSKRYPSKKKHF